MQTFLTSHSFEIGMVIYCLLSFARTYASETYGSHHKRTLTLSAIMAVVIVAAITLPLHSLLIGGAQRGFRVSSWLIAMCAIVGLFMVWQLVCAVKKLMSPDIASPVMDTSDIPRANLRNASTQWFGQQQLIMTEDRLYARGRYTLRDAGPNLWIFAIILIFVFWSGSGSSWVGFMIPCTWALGNIVSSKVKAERPRVLLEACGDRIFADGNDRGRIADAEIDVIDAKTFQNIRLVDKSPWMPLVLVTTKGAPPEQAEEIAEAIRAFLKARQEEQIWPPAPSANEAGSPLTPHSGVRHREDPR